MSLRLYLLGAVALALAGLVALDYWPSGPQAPLAPGPAVKPAAIPTLNPQAGKTEADFAALFDHPLFDPTRNRPMPEAPPQTAPAPEVAAEPTPAAPSGPAQPVLMGTVTSPWPGGAYLGDDAGGPVVFLRPGQAAQGLHLEVVQADSATFMGPVGEVTLTLRKSGAPGDNAAPHADLPQSPLQNPPQSPPQNSPQTAPQSMPQPGPQSMPANP
ncbi:hypothetical protein GC209_11295 [bacterium]|nr:hypothetical protein [bacterium]